LKAAISAIQLALLATILLISSYDYEFALGQDERPLFGGSVSDDERSISSNSESDSNINPPPSQRDQSEDSSTEGTPTVNIDSASSDSLSLLSHRVSTDEILDDPTMDINGEIQNNSTESLDFVKVTATFYDTTNSVIGSDFTYTDPYTLEPGQSAPFELTAGFGDDLPVDEIASIKLHVSGR
jgi:hypothetical protein